MLTYLHILVVGINHMEAPMKNLGLNKDSPVNNFESSSQTFKQYFSTLSDDLRAKVYNTMDFADGNNWDNWTWYNFSDSSS